VTKLDSVQSGNVPRDLGAALSREWQETNGLGGFASSTIIGLNTRRYHGLLVAVTKPPVRRTVTLLTVRVDISRRPGAWPKCCGPTWKM